jgi:sugar transferase (PEP-CTERM/EpsH1 system associated)
MNILLIDEEFPQPLNSGKKIRTYNLTRELSRTASITYLAYSPSDFDTRALEELGINCVSVVPPDRRQKGILFYFRLLQNLFSPLPYIVTSHFTARFQNALEEIVRRKKIDIVICEWTPYAIFVKKFSRCKSIIVAHNIESNIWRRYEENEKSRLRRWYISIQRKKVESFERICFKWVSGAAAVSNDERKQISALNNTIPVEVVDNGVDTHYFAPVDTIPEPHTLVFSGSMDWRPNQDAALFFADRIFPQIKSKYKNAQFTIVGRTPPASILKLGEIEGITVTGTVDDVRTFIAKASLVIVPLRIGGGTRLKILEAMSMRKPVLSTTIGAEGLEVSPGEDILIADNEAEWISAIETCFSNFSMMEQIANAGRTLVLRRYDWCSIGKKYADFLNKVAAK